ncbi:RNA-binding protein [Pontibacillus salicampi]|uniref:RNA-binding protein n=2 Tax=Pontibacillus salicampi TaxID=1449801 RepID=A0ABV6LNT1_9BACI
MELYQHFRKEEQPFIDQVLQWRDNVLTKFTPQLTDFLNPREQLIFQSLIGNHDELQWGVYGGAEQAERKRVYLAPFYEEIHNSDFHVTLLEATYPSKFVTLEHRDVLGAFMSLGIKRGKLGDLIVTNNRIQILVASEIASYVIMNLTGIKQAGIQLEEKDMTALLSSEEEWEESSGTVSSLRLDAILKEMYQISRQKASDYIQKGYVKVNFRMVEDPAFTLQEKDIISLRSKGRSQLQTIEGKTKKDKWRIITAKLK